MPPAPDDDNASVAKFMAELSIDYESRRMRSLEAYESEFPGHEREIREQYFRLIYSDDGTGMARTEEPESPPEERFGSYVIERELGSGGQGAVYLATDTRLGREVAVKILRQSRGMSQQSMLRFKREGELAGRLVHPNICEIYESGVEDGVPFLAMRYVAGSPLCPERAGDPIQSTPRSERNRFEWVLELIERLARALHYAHQEGVLHRDIKPGNILVTEKGEPMLLDFGLAKHLFEDGRTLTLEGQACGTPAYMAPEQLSMKGEVLDQRADIYSLGVVLFEMLTRAPAFRMPSLGMLPQAESRSRLPDMRSIEQSYNRDLRAVLETTLAFERSDRYDTAEDLAEDLRRVRESLPVSVRPAGPGTRFKRWVKRSPAVASVTLALIVSLLGGLGFSLYFLHDSILEGEESRWQAYKSRIALASTALRTGNTQLALALLEEIREDPNRGWEWEQLKRQTDATLRVLWSVSPDAGEAILSVTARDSDFVACTSRGRCIRLDLANDGDAVEMLPPVSPDTLAVTSGRLRVVRHGKEIRVTDLESKREISKHDLQSQARALAISPDGQHVVFVDEDRLVRFVSLSSGEVSQPFTSTGFAETVEFVTSPRIGLWLAISRTFGSAQRSSIEVLSWPSLAVVANLPIHGQILTAFTFSQSGERLLTAAHDPNSLESNALHLWDVENGTILATHPVRVGAVRSLAIARGDAKIAVGEASGLVRLLDGGLTTELASLRGHLGAATSVAFDSAGARLVTGSEDGQLRVFRSSRESVVVPLAGHSRPVYTLAFSRDESQIALGARVNTLWTYRHDGDLSRSEISCGYHDYITFDRNGTELVAWSRFAGASCRAIDLATGKQRQLFGIPPKNLPDKVILDGERRRAYFVVLGFDTKPDAAMPVEVRSWGAAPDRRLLHGMTSQVRRMALSRDGLTLAASGRTGEICIWDTESGELVGSANATGRIACLTLTANGDRLAVGTANGVVQLIDRDSGSAAGELFEVKGPVLAMAFSPDDKRLVVAVTGRKLLLWDTQRGEQVHSLTRLVSEVNVLSFTRSGLLAAGFRSGSVVIWNHRPRWKPRVEYENPPARSVPSDTVGILAQRLTDAIDRPMPVFRLRFDHGHIARMQFSPKIWYDIARRGAEYRLSNGIRTTSNLANSGLALLKLGRTREAVPLLQDAVALEKAAFDHPQVTTALALAICHDWLGADELAKAGIAEVEKFFAANPQLRPDKDVTLRAARLLIGNPRGEKAHRLVEQLIAERATVLPELAKARLSEIAPQDPELVELAERLFESRIESAEVYSIFAWLIASTPNLNHTLYDTALTWAQRSCELEDDAQFRIVRAACLVRLGRDRCVEAIESLRELSAESVTGQPALASLVFECLALCHLEKNREARATWNRLVVGASSSRYTEARLLHALCAEVRTALEL